MHIAYKGFCIDDARVPEIKGTIGDTSYVLLNQILAYKINYLHRHKMLLCLIIVGTCKYRTIGQVGIHVRLI